MPRLARIVAAVAALGVVFATGSWVGWKGATNPQTATTIRQALYYTCPMHPQYRSEKPGDCPSCGMKLEPVYAGGPSRDTPPAPTDGARWLNVDAPRQQLLGVRTGAAEMMPGSQVMRTVGRVAPDERRTYKIISAVDGWVQEIGAVTTGSVIAKDERLGSFYSPEFLGGQQALIFAAGALRRYQTGSETPEQLAVAKLSIKQAADSLRNMGMSSLQVDEITRTLTQNEQIWIVAPAAGVVLARNVSVGQRFEKGTELFQVADLGRVWVLIDVFGNEADLIRAGSPVTVTLPDRGRVYKGRISDIQPLFDESTRTLKFRVEIENPGLVLRPGMFVDVEFPVALPTSVTVPSEAVVDSGVRRTVFVDRGNGYFEPRRVQTGWRIGDRVQVVSGLQAGERIAVSGTFLLDSESRMRSVASGIVSPETDPVCGMDVDKEQAVRAGRTTTRNGTTYYFCSDQCRKDFEKNPAGYMK